MLEYIRDKMQSARLKARYQRLAQERVLSLIEASSPQPVAEDPGNWKLLGDASSELDETTRTDARSQARKLVIHNPYGRNILRLLEIYVVGPGLTLSHQNVSPDDDTRETARDAGRLWDEFLEENRQHFSYREYARRTWRDGECFLRKFSLASWPPTVRFIDPETIGATTQHPDSHGILSEAADVETPVAYLRIDPLSGELLEELPAENVCHTKIGVDSNQKRGLTIFTPILDVLSSYENWRDTELTARKLQASIVLWRKVHGSPSQAAALADATQSSSTTDLFGTMRRERYRAGTILTTSQGTELEFLQPNTNFGDAVPLGRLLLLSMAAGAGLPEFMLTADASNANYSSTMVAEGPAVKLFECEQKFFAGEFKRIWRWVMTEAINHGLLPGDFFDSVLPKWTFPQLVNRDRNKERLADVKLVKANVLSRSEIARREEVDPATMRNEIADEMQPTQ